MRHNELYKTFEQSHFGEEMVAKTRFDVFKPDWATTELWCDVLGDDVNNLRHMAHTARLAEMFSQAHDLSTDTTDLLLRTASTHDWGEAIIGDIPLPDKTDHDETLERIAYKNIATELLGEDEGTSLTSDVWTVLNKTDAHTGNMFQAIEYVGYCSTALRAGKMAVLLSNGITPFDITRAQGDQLVSGLSGLSRAVEVGNFPKLKGFAKQYPHIGDIMREVK